MITEENSVLSKILHFAKAKKNNAWIYHEDVHVYVRVNMKFIAGQSVKTLEIANITVQDPSKGYFTQLISELEEALALKDSDVECIFIENIFSPRFVEFFRKRGYFESRSSVYDVIICPCMYLLLQRSEHQE